MASPPCEPLRRQRLTDLTYESRCACPPIMLRRHVAVLVTIYVDLACRVMRRAESIFVDVSDAVAYAEHALLTGQKSDEHSIA